MIELLNIAFFSSIQDLGRNSSAYGVPSSGTMDRQSSQLANALVDNNKTAAVIEFVLPGSKIQFNLRTTIAITGANFNPQINGITCAINKQINIENGDILSFTKQIYGNRCYLAVSGGFNTELVLESRSMYKSITQQTYLKKGDILKTGKNNQQNTSSNTSIRVQGKLFTNNKLETFKGPEFECLTSLEQKLLLTKDFTVSKINNRMAYQLNEPFENSLEQLITSVVKTGTVQLTPNGQLIILMRDCQTTGGYPRVLQLTKNSINELAQKTTNDIIYFKLNNPNNNA